MLRLAPALSFFAFALLSTFAPTITIAQTPGFDFNVDATFDTDADNRWEDTVGGNPSGFDFELVGTVTRNTGVSSLPGIGAAYDFVGGATGNAEGALLRNTGSATDRSFQHAPGDWSNNNVTIEVWFRPDTISPTPTNGQILFEDGGGTGLGLFVDNGQLRLRKEPSTINAAANIGGASSEFIQAVATFNAGSNPDAIQLYINGSLIDAGANGNGGDWSGSDPVGLGTRGGANTGGIGGGQSSTESFDGQIAIFRVYENQILNAAQVKDNFFAVSNGTLGASLDYNAGDDDGANNVWENTGLYPTGNFDISAMSGQTHNASPTTTLENITGSYDFAGGASGGNLASLEANGFNDNGNVSFEAWIRPSDLVGDEVIFETGGGNGVGIFLGGGSHSSMSGVTDTELTFSVTQNSSGSQTARVSTDLSSIGIDEFIQVVGTFDFSGNGTSTLFINGRQVGTDTAAANITDWTGGDAAGIGRRGGANMGGIAGGQQGFSNYDGEISIFRVYENQLLSASDVQNHFIAIAGTDVFFDDGDAGDSDWGSNANWNTNAEPFPSQNAFINGGHTANLTQPGEIVENLTVGSNNTGGPNTPGTGTLNVQSGDLTVTNNLRLGEGDASHVGTVNQTGGSVVVGNDLQFGATGNTVNLYDLNGGTLSVAGDIVNTGGAERGHLYVDDPNSLTVTGNINIQSFRVGDSEAGSHTVNPGQTLMTTGTLLVGRAADGDLTILSTGNVAANMTVGDVGGSAGSTLTLDGGAELTVNGNTDVADQNNAGGTVNLRGGSTWTQNGNLAVGDNNSAIGVINIEGGSTLHTTAGRVDLARNNTTQGTINVTDGLLDIDTGGFYIAGDGTNDNNTQGFVTVGATGQIDVSGGNTEVGRGGTGELTVSGGTFNQLTNNLVLAQTEGGGNNQSESVGTVTINSGTINVGNSFAAVGNQDLNMNGGLSVFNHFGGDVNVERDLQMATSGQTTSNATYNLDAGTGTLTILRDLDVGQDRMGVFNYESGGFDIGGAIYVGGDRSTNQNAHANANGIVNIDPFGTDPTGASLTFTTNQFEVGRQRVGVVNQDGARVHVDNGNLVLGQYANSNGTYNLDAGILDADNQIRVGNTGSGTFNHNAGTVTVGTDLDLGNSNNVNSLGRYNMAGGDLDVGGDLIVGHVSPGSGPTEGGRFFHTGGAVEVLAGGATIVGDDATATGRYEMTGAGATLTTPDLIVGNNGVGTFVQSAGTVNVTDPDTYQVGAGGTGTVLHSGGTANVIGNLNVGTDGTAGDSYTLSGTGVLNFADTADGTQITTGLDPSTLTVGANGAFNFDGGTLMNVTTIDVTNAPGQSFDQNGGNFVIGVDGGLVTSGPNASDTVRAMTTITGDYNQNAGTLSIDIFGPNTHGINGELAGQPLDVSILDADFLDSDLLYVQGDAILNGTLAIDTNDFDPPPFGWYDVVLADGMIDDSNLTVTGIRWSRVIPNPDGPPGSFVLQVAVPEPASIALWSMLGLAAVGFSYRRLRSRK